jgi:multiple sugar transport system permease protein/putative aldouronate transport system permease protein
MNNSTELRFKTARRSGFRKSPGEVIFDVTNVTMFTIFMLLCIFPFYYLFINTISDNDLVLKGAITYYPIGINFSNYIALKEVNDLGNAFIVTITRTIFGTALMVFASALAGYLVTKKKLWKRSFWYRYLVITMYFNAGLIPWYMNMVMLGMTENYMAYIIPGIVAPFNIILVKTYVESIPGELEESAFMDGASTFTIFRKIIWPLSKPILATIAVFGAVGNWNSFQDSLILMKSSPQLFTLQHRLYFYLVKASDLETVMSGGAGTNMVLENTLNSKVVKYTIAMATIIPILLVYPIMQKHFVKGIMLGAIKG